MLLGVNDMATRTYDPPRKTIHIIEAPNGRFTLVGTVPVVLVTDDAEVQAALSHCGGSVARMLAKKKGARFTTSYPTREAAQAALDSIKE